MATPFALSLQRLSKGTDRVLVLADLATARSDDGAFETADVRRLFDAFRVPSPSNLPRDLAALERQGLVVRRLGGTGWAVTPEGEDAARTLLPPVEDSLELAAAAPQSAPFNNARRTTSGRTSPAPSRWREGIRRLTDEFAFEDNVFLMTRFPRGGTDDPVAPVIDLARTTLAEHALHLHVASDRILDPDLLGNVAAHMWASSFGVAVFECRTEDHLNENLLAEVGGMLVTGRRCALLKDVSVKRFPSDFAGQLYREVDLSKSDSVAQALQSWAIDDLRR